MKKRFYSVFAVALLYSAAAFAQTEIVVGDMNADGLLTVGDVTELSETVVGRSAKRIISPDASVPAAIAGSWLAVSGVGLTLGEDGTATYTHDGSVTTFEYYPFSRDLVLLNADDTAVKCLHVARLSADNIVFAQGDGSCTAFYRNSDFSTDFALDLTSLSLKPGDTQQLTLVATPEGSIVPDYTWQSSNPAVATVSADGLVTAVRGGNCTITAAADDGKSFSVTCSVDVVQYVESIELNESEITLLIDESASLVANVLPATAADLSITWSSSNEAVAEVLPDGTVSPKGYGTTIITAAANDGSGVKEECVVKVVRRNPLVFEVNGVTFTMRLVDAGTFVMGSDTGAANEKPAHTVTLTQDYYMGETEVTQELWNAVMGKNSSSVIGDKYPVDKITKGSCITFANQLSEMTGQNFRLPTEAEWEFAARGGNKTLGYTYSGSDDKDEVAWYSANSGSKIHEVATKQPNELGLYDMSGNASEWCSDLAGAYPNEAVIDPTGATKGNLVARGGKYSATSSQITVTARDTTLGSTNYYAGLGFRLALTPSE